MRRNNIFTKLVFLLLTVISLTLLTFKHASAQTSANQQVPSDYIIDIQQGEQQLQQSPKAMQVAQLIKHSEVTIAFDNGIVIPVQFKATQAESKESISELEPTPVPSENIVPQDDTNTPVDNNANQDQQQIQIPYSDRQDNQEVTPDNTIPQSNTDNNSQLFQNQDSDTVPTVDQSIPASPSIDQSNPELPAPPAEQPTLDQTNSDTPTPDQSVGQSDSTTPTPQDTPTQAVQGVSTGPNFLQQILLGMQRTYHSILH